MRYIYYYFFSSFFFHLTYSRWTSSLPSCLWSQRIFPSLPGSRLTIFFYRDASSALLQLVNQWLNFTILVRCQWTQTHQVLGVILVYRSIPVLVDMPVCPSEELTRPGCWKTPREDTIGYYTIGAVREEARRLV